MTEFMPLNPLLRGWTLGWLALLWLLFNDRIAGILAAEKPRPLMAAGKR